MPNSEILKNIIRFIGLILLQVFILNNINLGGYINPYLYIIFILLYPVNADKSLLIFLSFLLGLSIDVFEDSGGVHAGACAFIAYIRPVVLKYSFGVSYEYNSINLKKSDAKERFTYIAAMVFFHHIIMFSLEIFSFSHILLVFKSTLFSGVFSIILIIASLLLLDRKKS